MKGKHRARAYAFRRHPLSRSCTCRHGTRKRTHPRIWHLRCLLASPWSQPCLQQCIFNIYQMNDQMTHVTIHTHPSIGPAAPTENLNSSRALRREDRVGRLLFLNPLFFGALSVISARQGGWPGGCGWRGKAVRCSGECDGMRLVSPGPEPDRKS